MDNTNIFIHARQHGKSIMNSAYLAEIYKEYFGECHKPFVETYGRKGWESQRAHDLKGARKPIDAQSTPSDVSTLPAKRWVKSSWPKGSLDEINQWCDDRDAWLKEHKAKYQTCLVTINDEPTWVFLFKKESMALMFKLAWG